MMEHGVDWGPGLRYFQCRECKHKWDEVSRDCTSPSSSHCPECHEIEFPYIHKKRYDWPVDDYGNLLDNYDYRNHSRDHKLLDPVDVEE